MIGIYEKSTSETTKARSGAHGEMVAEPSDDALCHHQIHFVPPLGTSESLKRR
jgi:hypothetical protein